MIKRLYPAAGKALLVAVPALCASSQASCATKAKPNVVFFLVDDLGWSDIQCFGSSFYETPNVDLLAREGVRFTNAYTTCHVSSPARASLMTGRYPASINMTDWLSGRREFPFQLLKNVEVNQEIPAGVPTIADAFRAGGYHTGMIGKWHLGETGSTPEEHGFDVHVPHGYLKGWPARGYYAPFGMNGFDGDEGEYLTDRMTREAIKYIDSVGDEPFFLFMSHYATHDPIQGRRDLVEKYREKLRNMPPSDLPAFIFEGNPDSPDYARTQELIDEAISDDAIADHRSLSHRAVRVKQVQDNIQFAAMVEAMDESLGQIVAHLKELGIYDNTILVFFTDNGGMSAANIGGPNRLIRRDQYDIAYSTAQLPLRGGKGWLYEGGIRVPMIVKAPGAKKGMVCDQPVVSIDFFPTLLSMAGIRPPQESVIEGVDISPLLKKKKPSVDMNERPIFWHFPHYSNHGLQSPCGAVRKGDWKLIEYYENGTVQLFDIAHDMEEKNDLAASNPSKVDELRELLHQWRESVGAKMNEENPYFDERVAAKRQAELCPDRWWPLYTQHSGGLFGERIDLWRNNRLWWVADQDFLLGGFENRPGTHAWQGEHVGKWLHAASLAWNHTKDLALKAKLDEVARRLVATQLPDGYMGTYAAGETFADKPSDNSKYMWDVWTARYNLYGLLTYESFFHDEAIVEACRRMGDQLISVFGNGKNDITANGTRHGMSTTCLLESMVMLYERTYDYRYLDFARTIIEAIEANPELGIINGLLSGKKDISAMGDGKAYQLMANLLGYWRFYQATGEEKYMRAVQTAWNKIRASHLLSTGGVWTAKSDGVTNVECFASREWFDPEKVVVENCCNTTWIQLCLALFDFTATRKYMDEAESCLFNDLFGHQESSSGVKGCYYTRPNQLRPPYVDQIHCCNSSAPRAYELMADHIAGENDNALTINILTPAVIESNHKFGPGYIVVTGDYPLGSNVGITVDIDRQTYAYKEYAIEFRVPPHASLRSLTLNGEKVGYNVNPKGYISVKRVWNKGDVLSIDMDYQLYADVKKGKDGKTWVAFGYGPLALTGSVVTAGELSAEPFSDMNLSGGEMPAYTVSTGNGYPEISFTGTDVTLMPYSLAGSLQSGRKTYYICK